MDPIYYIITSMCVAGAAYTSFMLGRRHGIEQFIRFLETHTNNDNVIKIRITEDNVELIK